MTGELPLFRQGFRIDDPALNILAPGSLEATGHMWRTRPRGEAFWSIQILMEARGVLGSRWA